MKNVFLALLARSESVLVGEVPRRVRPSLADATGEPENQVVHFYSEGNPGQSIILTEEGIEKGRFNSKTQAFEVYDHEGSRTVVQMLAAGRALTPPDGSALQEMVYLVIQEGGSSEELYLHGHDSAMSAEEDQASCWDDAGYRTSEIVEVPASLANHPDFFEYAEKLIKAVLTLDGRGS